MNYQILFILLIFVCSISEILAQKALPLYQEKSYLEEATDEWIIEEKRFLSYDVLGNVVLDKGTYIYNDERSPFRREALYSTNGNLIYELDWFYDQSKEKLDTTYYHFLDYDDQDQLLSEVEWYNNGAYLIQASESIFTHNEGCIEKIETYNLDYNQEKDLFELIRSKTETYERDEDCRILTKESKGKYNETWFYYEYEYDTNNLLKEQREYYWGFDWTLSKEENYEYDTQNRLITTNSMQYSRSGDTLQNRSFYEYEDNRNEPILHIEEVKETSEKEWKKVVYESFFYTKSAQRLPLYKEYFFSFEEDVFLSENTFTYDLSESGKLLESYSVYRFYENTVLTRNIENKRYYTYRCDGLLKEERSKGFNIYPGILTTTPEVKTVYNYGENAPCEGLVSEPSSFLVFPNPTTEKINIKSKLLYEIGAQLKIYSIEGRLIYNSPSLRTELQEVDLSRFAKGIYIVELSREGQIFREKLVLRNEK